MFFTLVAFRHSGALLVYFSGGGCHVVALDIGPQHCRRRRLRSILTKIMTFMPFERLFDSISGGSIYLGTFCGSGKLLKASLTKIDPYKCFQSESAAVFWCIEELRSLAVQCTSFRLPTRNISSQRDQTDWDLFCMKYFGKKLKKRVPKIDVLGPINVAIIEYRHNHQNMFTFKSNHL